jgi:multidrug resistance efflux pump
MPSIVNGAASAQDTQEQPVARRRLSRRGVIVLGVVLAAVVLAAVLLYRWIAARHAPPVYSGTVETREIEIGSKIGGRVTAVAVEEGQLVSAGAPLVSFEADELKAQRAQAEASVEQGAADLNRLQTGNRPEEMAQADAALRERAAELQEAKNGPRPEDLRQAQADYAAAKADAVNAAATWARMQPLVEKDVISHQQFDGYTAQRDSTAQRAESARQRLAELQAGTRVEDIQAAQDRYQQALAADTLSHQGFRKQDIQAGQGRLTAAQAQVAALDAQLREANLAAPADGVIETVSVRPGDLVPPNQIVVTMLESSQLWVKVYVPETDLSRLKVGQTADVEVDAVQQRHFNGRIQEIASEAEFLPRNVQTRDDREHEVFGVKVQVENPGGVLKSGMSATVQLR